MFYTCRPGNEEHISKSSTEYNPSKYQGMTLHAVSMHKLFDIDKINTELKPQSARDILALSFQEGKNIDDFNGMLLT